MKLYEFLFHIKNLKKCVLPIKVIFSYITPYIGGAANAFCSYLRTGLRYRDAVDDNLLSVWFWAVIRAWTLSFGVSDPSKGHLRSHEEVMGEITSFLQTNFKKMNFKTWEWYNRVCLIKTHRHICDMTYFDHHVTTKAQLRNLTSGQVTEMT